MAAQEEPQAGCEAAGHDGGQHACGGSPGPGPAVRRAGGGAPRCPGRMVRVFFFDIWKKQNKTNKKKKEVTRNFSVKGQKHPQLISGC